MQTNRVQSHYMVYTVQEESNIEEGTDRDKLSI